MTTPNDDSTEKASSTASAGYAACPFCGAQGVPVVSHTLGAHPQKVWWIQCPRCHACGPTALDLKLADAKWSQRQNAQPQPTHDETHDQQ